MAYVEVTIELRPAATINRKCMYIRAALGSSTGHSSLFVARFDSANLFFPFFLFSFSFLFFLSLLLENRYGHGLTGRTGGAGPVIKDVCLVRAHQVAKQNSHWQVHWTAI